MDQQTEQFKVPETWAIIELMGHDRTAGRYSFENGLHRVDVPGDNGDFNTEMIGSGAIFRLRFVDEAAARLAARSIRPNPVGVWELRKEMERLVLESGSREVEGPMREYMDESDRYDDD